MHNLAATDDGQHPYSLVRIVDGETGYCSGVLPLRPDGGLESEPEAAIAAALRTLGERLEQAGSGIEDVVKVTVFLTDMSWRPTVDAAWRRTWDQPPARTAVEVARLPREALIELDAIVHRSRK